MRERLARAIELGHQVHLEQRGPWPERGDRHPKFYVSCSCGWTGTVTRSSVAAGGKIGYHVMQVLDAEKTREELSANPARPHSSVVEKGLAHPV